MVKVNRRARLGRYVERWRVGAARRRKGAGLERFGGELKGRGGESLVAALSLATPPRSRRGERPRECSGQWLVTLKSLRCVLRINLQAVGGPARNRTGVHGFAVRCVTTPPPGHPGRRRKSRRRGRAFDTGAFAGPQLRISRDRIVEKGCRARSVAQRPTRVD